MGMGLLKIRPFYFRSNEVSLMTISLLKLGLLGEHLIRYGLSQKYVI